jgi:hypothetical protein
VRSLLRTRRPRRAIALTTTLALALLGVQFGAAPAAHAQQVDHTERYASQSMPIANWAQFANDGTPIAKDPSCPTYAGVFRWSKVWVDTYGLDESWHSQFRMQFHTTYAPAVAVAKLALAAANAPASWQTCAFLNSYKGMGVVDAMAYSACLFPAGKPVHWCSEYSAHPNDPALDMQLQERCAGIAGGPYPTVWHEWHNLGYPNGASKMYDVDVLAQLNQALSQLASKLGLGFQIPVYLDTTTILGGVRNYDQASGQPAFGNTWLGYGNVVTPKWADLYLYWYDAAAKNLGLDPVRNPVASHNAVDSAIASGQRVVGLYGMTRDQVFQVVCANTQRLKAVLDPGGVVSAAGLAEDLSNWIKVETGKTLCENVQKQFPSFAPFACRNGLLGQFFSFIDNNDCMNQQATTVTRNGVPVTYPPSGLAQALNSDIGCNRNDHLVNLFTQIRHFLGG